MEGESPHSGCRYELVLSTQFKAQIISNTRTIDFSIFNVFRLLRYYLKFATSKKNFLRNKETFDLKIKPSVKGKNKNKNFFYL